MPTYEELRGQAEQARQPTPGPQRPLIKVGVTTCSRAVGAQETLDAVRKELADRGPSTGSGQATGLGVWRCVRRLVGRLTGVKETFALSSRGFMAEGSAFFNLAAITNRFLARPPCLWAELGSKQHIGRSQT